jgi:hypothetical protein
MVPDEHAPLAMGGDDPPAQIVMEQVVRARREVFSAYVQLREQAQDVDEALGAAADAPS